MSDRLPAYFDEDEKYHVIDKEISLEQTLKGIIEVDYEVSVRRSLQLCIDRSKEVFQGEIIKYKSEQDWKKFYETSHCNPSSLGSVPSIYLDT
jgi:hypothetical protein